MNIIQIYDELDNQKRKVDFNSYDFSARELVNMISEGIIDIAPEYQRQFRWDDDRQSKLIESLLLGIPIPNLFMATNSNRTWEVIDGVQRLTTIIRFMGNDEAKRKVGINTNSSLVLQNLDKLPSFNGLSYSDLPHDIKIDFTLKGLKVVTLTDKSDASVRFDLFERLNTGGVKLSSQEIRSCVYRGEFNNFLKEMAKNADFKFCLKLKEEQERDGTNEEAVLRFFAFLYNYKVFKSSVIGFLNDYMEKVTRKEIPFDFIENKKLFEKVFAKLAQLPHGISRNQSGTRSGFRVNLYEGVAVGAALAMQEKGDINLTNFAKWVQDKSFKKATTGATNQPKLVAKRIEFARDQFLK
ncbi:DUF262 domain-containing protein [Actinobacillus equuli]|uniref:DUF262 domain-containing protein n=1 Tax=Actinobacillus equuli TaxID=718 RepID=UPI0024417950|nr:DUF262 domain-containing protein [Actinobacillus equuli]WGE51335.1 DUF262 domain-containing protein [Actinobacillus equuli subsp. haemolyticus]WGE53448.1 DUF262 domain-containing protein [Actinobacillus equuli subsp. haemolyticus]WGE73883.1 DUF262 domain-containing protein [Actinobacillus equuli subsp. haemolyticus]